MSRPRTAKSPPPTGRRRKQSLLQRVKAKLSNVVGKERADIIRGMSFGEQVAGIENGLISRQEKPYAIVRNTTPDVFIQKAGAEQLPIIMSYDKAYRSVRSEGTLQGHYHSLGAELMAQIPDALNNPLALIQQKNGRIFAVLDLKDKIGKSLCSVIELSAIKDLEGEYLAYNLIVTAFGAKESYIHNLMKNGENTILQNKLPG